MPGSSVSNGRVTMAILGTEVRHLTDEVRGYREDTKIEMRALRQEMKEMMADHETRIRCLEGSNRQGLYRDIGAFVSAVGAGLFGWLTAKP